ncbi:hypothetical protein [uncultured Gammaproteobacteria bacterium]|nr:hypothetical protein [uncultured Gammaproteobacteria bacterium]CAC9971960.1 hypothetical protein [uncultured Gammaproteobacteria bacterium]
MIKKRGTGALDRRKFLSKSFKVIVNTSIVIIATKVPAYEQYLGEDSTNVDVSGLALKSTDVPPHSSHSSRSWR